MVCQSETTNNSEQLRCKNNFSFDIDDGFVKLEWHTGYHYDRSIVCHKRGSVVVTISVLICADQYRFVFHSLNRILVSLGILGAIVARKCSCGYEQ